MGWLEDYLDYGKESEAPDVYHEASGLATLAGAVERKIWLNQGIGLLYPNLYMVLVGPPAARKTAGGDLGISLLTEIPDIAIAPDKITEQAMYIDMESSIKEFFWKGQSIKHTSYTVFASEWGFFIGKQNVEFLTALIKLYDCEKRFRYYTKHQGRNVMPNVWLNMLGCIQPDMLVEVLPLSAIGSGFTSRIIYVVADGPRHSAPLPSFNEMKRVQLVRDLTKINRTIGEFGFSDKARKFYIDWYETAKDKSHLVNDKKFQSYLHRKPQHMLKIGLLMSISRTYGEENVVEMEDLLEALAWLEKIEIKMPEAYGAFGCNPDALLTKSIEDFIRHSKTASIAEILKVFWRDVNDHGLRRIIDTMKAKGVIDYSHEDRKYVWKGD